MREEFIASRCWYERLAGQVTTFVGHPHFLLVHLVWFVIWALLNIEILPATFVFDAYPFSLLGIILSVEAIFITGFLLMAAKRDIEYADKLAELDYEVNVRAYRKMRDLENTIVEIHAAIGAKPVSKDPSKSKIPEPAET